MEIGRMLGPQTAAGSLQFTKAYVVTMRPYLMFVSGMTGIAGLSFVSDLSPVSWALVALASFLSYGFGQALTDCFQTDTDALSSPYRPLVRGVVKKGQVLTVSIIGLGVCVTAFAVANPVNLLLGIVAGLGLASYTPFKRKWWAGPFYNAWIVAFLFLMAGMAGNSPQHFFSASRYVPVLAVVFFGYANFVLSGYFKDIEADRATGYNTLPVVFGRGASVLVSDLFAVLSLVAAAIATITQPGGFQPVSVSLFGLAGAASLTAGQWQLHRVRTDEQAYRAIEPIVHGYILLLSSMVLLGRPEWVTMLVAYYALFVLVIRVRPAQDQI